MNCFVAHPARTKRAFVFCSALARYLNNDTGSARVSVERLSQDTGWSVDLLKDGRSEARRMGMVKMKKRRRPGTAQYEVSSYQAIFPDWWHDAPGQTLEEATQPQGVSDAPGDPQSLGEADPRGPQPLGSESREAGSSKVGAAGYGELTKALSPSRPEGRSEDEWSVPGEPVSHPAQYPCRNAPNCQNLVSQEGFWCSECSAVLQAREEEARRAKSREELEAEVHQRFGGAGSLADLTSNSADKERPLK